MNKNPLLAGLKVFCQTGSPKRHFVRLVIFHNAAIDHNPRAGKAFFPVRPIYGAIAGRSSARRDLIGPRIGEG